MRYLLLILLVSCTTERKAVKYFDRHQDVAGNYCTGKFPVLPIVDTVIVGYDSSAFDAVYNEMLKFVDSLLSLPHDTAYIHDTIRIKGRMRYVLTPCKDSTVTLIRTVENKAKITALEAEKKDLEKQVYHLKTKGNGRLLIIFGLAAFIILLLAMLARKWF